MNKRKNDSTIETSLRALTSHEIISESELDRKLNTVPLVRGDDGSTGTDQGPLVEPMVRGKDSGLPFDSGFRNRTGFSVLDEILDDTHTDMRSLEECDVLICIALLMTDLDYAEAVNLMACAGAVLARDIVSGEENRDIVLRFIHGRMSDAYSSYDRTMGDIHHPLIDTVDDIIEFGLRDDISDILGSYIGRADDPHAEDEDYE